MTIQIDDETEAADVVFAGGDEKTPFLGAGAAPAAQCRNSAIGLSIRQITSSLTVVTTRSMIARHGLISRPCSATSDFPPESRSLTASAATPIGCAKGP